MDRQKSLKRIKDKNRWDIVVIGGGASGLGIAVDAASRGYDTLLLEAYDFAKGTSSRSTKLVHGGVRYLEQGNISLVREALKERGYFLKNAPHLAREQAFIVPIFSLWERLKYTIGLKLYEWLSGKFKVGKVSFLSREKVLKDMPGMSSEKLKGGVMYYDGQFDDARMAVNLAETCEEQGGTVINYMKVSSLHKDNKGKVNGLEAVDQMSRKKYSIQGRVVINATGIFADDVHAMDSGKKEKTILPSQGVHLVLPPQYLKTVDFAMMIPKTDDGRVLFLVPWHDHLLMGTTDTPLEKHALEPRALENEIKFILRNAQRYLKTKPSRKDVLSIFAGQRPLALPQGGAQKDSKDISRGERIQVSDSGLISVTGGKWTTYRHMGEITVNKAIAVGSMTEKKGSQTTTLKIHGWTDRVNTSSFWDVYGADRDKIHALVKENPHWGKRLNPDWPLTYAEVVWAVREEMAMQVEDVLARRSRILFLNAKAAMKMAPKVAEIMRKELEKDIGWEEEQVRLFTALAEGYDLGEKFKDSDSPSKS